MNSLWSGTLEQVQIAEDMKNKKLYTAPPRQPEQRQSCYCPNCETLSKELEFKLRASEAEKDNIYRLLAMAHLNLRQHLQYGFNPKTAHSTLISVGRYYPQLRAKMEKQEAEMQDKLKENT